MILLTFVLFSAIRPNRPAMRIPKPMTWSLALQRVGESGSAANFVWKLPWPKPKTEIVRRTGVGLIGSYRSSPCVAPKEELVKRALRFIRALKDIFTPIWLGPSGGPRPADEVP